MATLKILPWTEKKAETELKKRLDKAKRSRARWEKQWANNERTLFSSSYEDYSDSADVGIANIYDALQNGFGGVDGMNINYSFKYLRFIHSQMSANPPSVIPVPTSTEYKDRRASRVAGNFVNHGRRKLGLQEKSDLVSLQTITYGSGFGKICFDPYLGDSWEVDESTGEITMQGDIAMRPMLIWDMWIDANATAWDEVEYTFERQIMDYSEAIARWPDKKELLESIRGKVDLKRIDVTKEDVEDLVEVFEYYEKALPMNGMDGRRIFHTREGKLLSKVNPNPHPKARLPYHLLTDVDVPGEVYGKTFIDYIVQLQDIVSRIDSTILDNIRNHGVARMVVYDATEVDKSGLSNDSVDVMNIKGGGAMSPHFIPPPTLMPDLYKVRQQIEMGMESLAGVNESMFGQVKREMSGYSLQTAINAGNMVRRRLFNKYQGYCVGLYTDYLELIQDHYTDPRKILIAGEEESVSVAYFSGSDISGGFDLKVEYGAEFSLDPAGRREEILQLREVMKEAGIDGKKIMSMLRLNELNVGFDDLEVGKRRQFEIFDEIIAKYTETGVLIQIAPEENEDHASMLEACKEFRMSMTFKALPKELRDTVDAHFNARKDMLATQAAGAMPPAGAAPMMPAPGGMPMQLGPAAPGAEAPIAGMPPGLPQA
jgi:hypothetical protein